MNAIGAAAIEKIKPIEIVVVKFLLEHNVKLGRARTDSAIYPGRAILPRVYLRRP